MSHPKKDLSRHSDEELLRLLKEHDHAALSALFERHGTDLYLYIKKIVSTVVAGEKARCVTQKILIDLFISLPFNPPVISAPDTLANYLFATAHGIATDHVSRRIRGLDQEVLN
jgi:DNA-directed RNA polymerase specialized sigma24 family protein